MKHSLTWVEISKKNLQHNIRMFKQMVGPDKILCPAVKGNAYGHGLTQCAPLMVEAGADWLGVNALFEAVALRESGVTAPIYVMGYVSLHELSEVVERDFHFVVYNPETLEKLAEICTTLQKPAFTHLKLETGNNRQGVLREDLEKIVTFYKSHPLIKLEGLSSHFANIEDTTDHSYAGFQFRNFTEMGEEIERLGINPTYRHCANTASVLLFPHTHFNFVRTGIGNYGLWPSKETLLSVKHLGGNIDLRPVMSWKTRVAQVKKVASGSFIGYGCSYRTTGDTKLAILPVGYYDGYNRRNSNTAYVLIHGRRAPIRGRVCMNISMVDVSDIPDVKVEDEVILLGQQGDEYLSAEQLAKWNETISYEITTSINDRLDRKVV